MIIDSYQNKVKILNSFLGNCAFDGWNDQTLEKSAQDCNIDPKQIPLIFENGIVDLTNFFIEENNKKTAEKISKIDNFSTLKIREKIATTLKIRIEFEKENKAQLQSLFNFYISSYLKPLSLSLKHCYKVADFIWYEIGDKSTDFNFYTKRLTLSKIILRTLMVFMKDESEDLLKTNNFIDSQIAKVMRFEKCKAKAKTAFREILLDDKGDIKTFSKIIEDLPFFRLRNKK